MVRLNHSHHGQWAGVSGQFYAGLAATSGHQANPLNVLLQTNALYVMGQGECNGCAKKTFERLRIENGIDMCLFV